MRLRLFLMGGLLVAAVALLGVAVPGTTSAQQDMRNHDEIVRRLAEWKRDYPPDKYPQFYKGITFDSAAPAGVIPQPVPGDAKGRALIIGLNGLDPDRYGGWPGTLEGCENDADAMKTIADNRGFGPAVVLKTGAATRERVFTEIRNAAANLEKGDIFLITYSGHGGQVDDTNGDEEDRLDETWCLFDGEVIDDELAELWAGFKSGVRILMLSDSCHSGSIAKFQRDAEAVKTIKLPRARGPDAALQKKFADFNKSLEAYIKDPKLENVPKMASPVRAIPEDIQKRVLAAQQKFYEPIFRNINAKNLGERTVDIKASVLLISGCQDKELSMESGGNGVFTREVVVVWDGGRFPGDYTAFHKKLLVEMPDTQNPNLFPVPENRPDTAFLNQKPFTIK